MGSPQVYEMAVYSGAFSRSRVLMEKAISGDFVVFEFVSFAESISFRTRIDVAVGSAVYLESFAIPR